MSTYEVWFEETTRRSVVVSAESIEDALQEAKVRHKANPNNSHLVYRHDGPLTWRFVRSKDED